MGDGVHTVEIGSGTEETGEVGDEDLAESGQRSSGGGDQDDVVLVARLAA